MRKIAIVAALERELSGLIRSCTRVEQQYEGRTFVFFERDEMVAVAGGIGMQAARRAAEAVIALYRPVLIQSVGFAGALDAGLHIGDLFTPTAVIDARDGSRVEIDVSAGQGRREKAALVTFMEVAGGQQKRSLAKAYSAQAVDMEASAVAAAAQAHGIAFGATKVISDELGFEMPEIGRFIDFNGQFKTASFVAFAVMRPWLWKRVAQLAANSRKAAKALSAHVERFRPELTQAGELNSISILESIPRSQTGVKRI